MPTSFIAVQCFECSTMQVKQQKKSSNKWICVVCNHKQSVRKVFAQSFMAKDVRKVVQSFNMSRQFSDQKQSPPSDDESHQTDYPKIEEPKRKRNDWSEYIDDEQEECCGKFESNSNFAQGDDAFEPAIVTEMPPAVFSKPKVKNYSSGSRSSAEKLCLKPSFPSRRNGKRHQNDTPCSERAEDNCSESLSLKWNSFAAQIRDNCKPPVIRSQPIQVINYKNYSNSGHKVSKWSSFITEDEADDVIADRSCESERRDDHPWELSMNDEKVEDDIHPDFL